MDIMSLAARGRGVAIVQESYRALLEQVREGRISVEQALQRLCTAPYEDLGFARVDHRRLLQKGFPEVIYSPGKTAAQIVEIARRLSGAAAPVLVTRAGPEIYGALQREFPRAEYHREARMVVMGAEKKATPEGCVGIVTAGTADLPVAEEAALTAEMMGSRVTRLYDVGVAGLHRLLDNLEPLFQAHALVVAAGMEGALPSVVGGLVACPIVAVPTSAGYGANFGGLAPLLAMLNSCAPGVAVVNIDNGFGAGYMAALINLSGGEGGDAS